MSRSQTISADLAANGGHRGRAAVLKALIYDPGFTTVYLYRLSARLLSRWPRLSQIVLRINAAMSGCYIQPYSRIGPGLALPHPVGIVVGSGVVIGARVTLYQGVTLGRSGDPDAYPRLEDGVVVYPNAVLVGRIVVGRGAVVGAGSFVNADVPADVVVAGSPARIVGSAVSTASLTKTPAATAVQ